MVKASQRSEVWIFDCVSTKNPPNTGAGPNAKSDGAAPPLSEVIQDNNVAIWLGFLWPLLAFGGYALRRRSRQIERRAA